MLVTSLFTTLAALASASMVAADATKATAGARAAPSVPPQAILTGDVVQCGQIEGTTAHATLNPAALKCAIEAACTGKNPKKMDSKIAWNLTELQAPKDRLYANTKNHLMGWDMSYEADKDTKWVFKVASQVDMGPLFFSDDMYHRCVNAFHDITKKCQSNSGGAWSPTNAFYLYTA